MSYDATGYGYNEMDDQDPYGQGAAGGVGMDPEGADYYGAPDEDVITQEDW